MNDGDGRLSQAFQTADRSRVPYAIAAGDLNRDGSAEIVLGYVRSATSVFFNDGSGRQFTETRIGDGNGDAYGFAIGDVNLDGYPDIALAKDAAPSVLFLAQPERVAAESAEPRPVWTKTADAPAGVLSHALEGQRHDAFIELAQQGNIDLVFFGTTETEMWSWNARGKRVWDREFGSLKAANFGSQGTSPTSLLWRMQNGELDGYEAKLIVLQLGSGGRIADPFSPNREAEFLAAWRSVIGAIRARQPQAKILLTAPVPRGIAPGDRLESWREVADLNGTVIAQLTDDETVFYADFGERFFLSDGSYNHTYWGLPGTTGVGMQPPAYDVLAEALEPWIDRFVR